MRPVWSQPVRILDFTEKVRLVHNPQPKRLSGTACLAAVLFGAGDVLAQQGIEKKGANHDVRSQIQRTLHLLRIMSLTLQLAPSRSCGRSGYPHTVVRIVTHARGCTFSAAGGATLTLYLRLDRIDLCASDHPRVRRHRPDPLLFQSHQ